MFRSFLCANDYFTTTCALRDSREQRAAACSIFKTDTHGLIDYKVIESVLWRAKVAQHGTIVTGPKRRVETSNSPQPFLSYLWQSFLKSQGCIPTCSSSGLIAGYDLRFQCLVFRHRGNDVYRQRGVIPTRNNVKILAPLFILIPAGVLFIYTLRIFTCDSPITTSACQ